LRSNLFVAHTKKAVTVYNSGNHETAYQTTKDMLDELITMDVQDEHTADFSDIEALLEKARLSVVNAIPLGIPPLEKEMGGGLQPQTLTVVLGGTNVGKTTFCVSLAYYAIKAKKRVCFVVLEDEEESIKIKILSCFARIPINKLYAGYAMLSDEERERVKRVQMVLKRYLTIRFQYGIDMDVESLIDWVSQKHRSESPFDLVIIDYGQILTSRRRLDGAYETQKYVHRALKQMANTLGVAVLTPAQGNRLAQKVSNTGADYLRATDLSECFDLARIANNVLTINRSEKDQSSNRIVFFLEKQRRGRVKIAVESVSNYSMQLTHDAAVCREIGSIDALNDIIPNDDEVVNVTPNLEDP
jgi:replicative DNA helicase